MLSSGHKLWKTSTAVQYRPPQRNGPMLALPGCVRPPQIAGRSKHDGPSAPPSAGAISFGADLRRGFKKNLCMERAGVSHAERVRRLVWPPMGTRMQSSDVPSLCLINKRQFPQNRFMNCRRDAVTARGAGLRIRQRIVRCVGPGQCPPIMPCFGQSRATPLYEARHV